MTPYADLIARKRVAFEARGFTDVDDAALHARLFDHQRHGAGFALRAGCAALFYDTGLGKTGMALTWGDDVVRRTNKPVLMLAPLAVGPQHMAEAEAFGLDARLARSQADVKGAAIYIANYERLHLFDPDAFAGVILDESSIIKSFTGATTRKLMAAFEKTPYRLAATATPAPNDHMELGQHAQFLGVMRSAEMLSRWFIADQTAMGRYRLKRPAVKDFWDWVASWARCVSTPSDLGFSDEGFTLPPLEIVEDGVAADLTECPAIGRDGQATLFRTPDLSATALHGEKRRTAPTRADRVAERVMAEPSEPWIVWCDTDYEADAIMARLSDAVEVRGSMRPEMKEERLIAFSAGDVRTIVTKPKIAGFGLNWQHCARHAFAGVSYSYEAFYQAVRRSWRFGQTRPVKAFQVFADTERPVLERRNEKATEHDAMKIEMRAAMGRAAQSARVFEDYRAGTRAVLPAWLSNNARRAA